MHPLLTIAEVAQRLRVSRTTAYQLVERGQLIAHRIGTGRGAIRLSKKDLADYLERCRQTKGEGLTAPEPPTRRLRHLQL
ncbi:MAG: helix-turn-helix domain-containing protein [Planctomycetota bacterium]